MIKKILAVVIFIAGIIAAIYFGAWVLLIKSILTACAAFDAGTLTAMLVGWTVIKCLLASTVAAVIIWISAVISAFIASLGD